MTNELPPSRWSQARRDFLRTSTLGLGGVALASLFNEGRAQDVNPLRPRPGHFTAKAKNVIFLFMAGGPSHLDLFDPKPTLQRLDGQVVPESFTRGRRFAFIRPDAKLLGSKRRFARAGQGARKSASSCRIIGKSPTRFACSRA